MAGVTKKKFDIVASAAIRDGNGNRIDTTYVKLGSPLLGKTIKSIAKTATSGLTDTYTITFTDNTTWDYYVTNGKDGTNGAKGDKGDKGNKGDTGLGISDVDVNSNNQIVATMTDGSTKTTSALTTVKSLNNMTGDVTIDKGDLDLGNVENKSTATIKSEFTGSVAANNTGFVTGGAVKTYVDNAINNLPEPMIFKGTLGTNGMITSLPTAASSNEGFTYKVITAGTYASQSAKLGDVFVSNGISWVLIPAGDDVEDTWRQIEVNGTSLLNTGISTGAVNFKSGTNVTVSGSGNDITISSTYKDTGATSVEATGNGNVVSGASYDASTRKITLNKGVAALTSHQAIKTLKTDNTTALDASSSEDISGSGTINLHKVAKTGNYMDLINKPSIYNGTLTIKGNDSTAVAFRANQVSDVSLNIVGDGATSVTAISDITNHKITISSTDTGATSVEVTGSGNAVSGASYDASTRKITLTKGVTAPTKAEHLKALYNLGAYDSVDTSNADYDVVTRGMGYYKFTGNETWTRSGNNAYICRIIEGVVKNPASSSVLGNIKSPTLSTETALDIFNGVVSSGISINNEGIIFISLSDYENRATLVNGTTIEYELADSFKYTDPVLKNQPISQLDHNGENWLRGDYEKTLNLIGESAPKKTNDTDFGSTGQPYTVSGRATDVTYHQVKPNTTYTISNLTGRLSMICYYGSTKAFISRNSIGANSYTFTTGSSVAYIRISSLDGNEIDFSKTMLNLGSIALPYQPYNGPVMHAIDVQGVLLWQNGNTSSMMGADSTTISNIFDYSFIDVLTRDSTDANDADQIQRIRLRPNTRNKAYLGIIDGSVNYHRTLIINTDSTIEWSNGYIGASENNAACIISAIYGIK